MGPSELRTQNHPRCSQLPSRQGGTDMTKINLFTLEEKAFVKVLHAVLISSETIEENNLRLRTLKHIGERNL